VSLALTSSNVSTTKRTIKQIFLAVFIGETVSTKSGMVENNRSSTKDRI